MYLKRLELHGFKSFASSTTFELGTGVTCIVGPNGSGKTNVADAIRWVLGEQASRVIRARKTEDVIFSGSAKRPPMGMAEVRIVLDNADGWLPLAFEEVVVSRRAYRNGDNEYYLNQSRVRLKDITELFLKAQVGQNSYAFMSQGLVDEVLTLRPDERRGLIEEAADVRLHRVKLDDASNRLRATRENLDRIGMIVAEIEPRLRQLERQANRADVHARLSGELAEALHLLFGHQWQEAQDALAAARAACDQRQQECDTVRKEFASREEGVAAITAATQERRQEIANREEAHRNLEEYRRDLQRRITLDGERQSMLAGRGEELASEIETLRAEREEMARLLAQHEERARTLEEELGALAVPEDEAREAEQTEARLRELRQELTEAERSAAQASAHAAEAEAKVASLEAQQQRLTVELATLQQERREQLEALKAWARELAVRQQRYQQLEPVTQRGLRDLSEIEARLAGEATAAEGRREEVRTLTAELETAQVRLDAAQAADVELPAPDAGVRALLAAGGRITGMEPAPDARIHGMSGMLGEFLRVPAGLERAIEAALAEHLHAIVVQNQDDALAAVELLVSEELGRATVLPLADVRTGYPLNLLEERGVVGVASQLVRCEQRFRPLLDTLLGRTIVVENLGIAKAVLRRGLGTVVTLDGILLHPLGSITAGSAQAIRRAITHQREVRELPDEVERLRTALKDATAAAESGEQQLAATQQARDTLAAEVGRLRDDFSQAEDALRRHRARPSAAAARLAALNARRSHAQRSLDEADRALTSAKGSIEDSSHEAADHQTRTDSLRSELAELTAFHEQLLRGGSERSSKLAALGAEREVLQQLRTGQQATFSRVEQELTRRSELATRLEEELRTVQGRLELTQQELDQKAREADAAREELEPARAALEQLDSRQRTIDGELAAARAAVMEVERALLDAEASVHLRSEELEALRARLEEEGYRPSPDGEVVRGEDERDGEGPPQWLAAERAGDEEIPPMRGSAQVDPVALKDRVSELREEIRGLGPVNEQAQTDYAESRERHDYLTGQLADLEEAEGSLLEAIDELEAIIKERFSVTFRQVNKEFQRYFETFFGGGSGELLLTKSDEDGLPGVEITAQPPRKRVRSLQMLSGGERSLTAVALLFALLATRPSPICVLDEVDAALDEANVDRFATALRELAEATQFIIITHNRRTIEMADTIYGASMGDDSTTTILSLRLSDIAES